MSSQLNSPHKGVQKDRFRVKVIPQTFGRLNLREERHHACLSRQFLLMCFNSISFYLSQCSIKVIDTIYHLSSTYVEKVQCSDGNSIGFHVKI
jgi:hypothetical protein